MAFDILPDPQYTAPAAADGVAVSPGGGWVDSAVVELLAAADADLILTGVVVRATGFIFTGFSFEVDILTGAAASEVPIATWRGYLQEVNSNTGSDGLYLPSIIGIDAIPSGERLSARMRTGALSGFTFHVSATYLKKPLTGTLLTTSNPLKCEPSAAIETSVRTGLAAWSHGLSTTAVLPGGGPARAVVGVTAKIDRAATEWEVDICTSESDDVATTIRGSGGGVSSFPNYIPLPHPVVLGSGLSVSVRARCDEAQTSFFCDEPLQPPCIKLLFGMTYVELPL